LQGRLRWCINSNRPTKVFYAKTSAAKFTQARCSPSTSPKSGQKKNKSLAKGSLIKASRKGQKTTATTTENKKLIQAIHPWDTSAKKYLSKKGNTSQGKKTS
jgi:hypothetical protein